MQPTGPQSPFSDPGSPYRPPSTIGPLSSVSQGSFFARPRAPASLQQQAAAELRQQFPDASAALIDSAARRAVAERQREADRALQDFLGENPPAGSAPNEPLFSDPAHAAQTFSPVAPAAPAAPPPRPMENLPVGFVSVTDQPANNHLESCSLDVARLGPLIAARGGVAGRATITHVDLLFSAPPIARVGQVTLFLVAGANAAAPANLATLQASAVDSVTRPFGDGRPARLTAPRNTTLAAGLTVVIWRQVQGDAPANPTVVFSADISTGLTA